MIVKYVKKNFIIFNNVYVWAEVHIHAGVPGGRWMPLELEL